jgi:hypothetical protein
MKLAIRSIPVAMTLAVTGLFGVSVAHAVTAPMFIGDFNTTRSQPLTTKSTSWRDSAFGDMGWTHNSGWGKFWAKAGQVVTIKAVSSNPNVHPGISVWYRGADDTAPDNYVADHFYPQNANQYVKGAKDETTQAVLGDIAMKIVEFGFDKDLNKLSFLGKGITDTVSGQLVLKFTAKTTGNYMFVVGGFSLPHASVDPALKYTVQTTVTRTTPTTP